jgi:site-specific DNA recombinase
MRVLAYCRADTQASGRGPGSVPALTKAFTAFCLSHGHNLQGVIADDAESVERPEYTQMVEGIKSSGLAYLIVLRDVDDLGEGMEEQVGKLLELDALACQVVCDDPEGPDPLKAAVRSWKSKSPAALRGESIREGMQAKAARGLGLGKPPYGYRIGSNGIFETVPSEVEVVRLIFNLYLDQDMGVRSIARYLNEQGYRTRRGEAWSMVTIRDVLRNHAYIGTYQRFGLRIPSSHPAIVSPDEFKRVQDRMRSRSPARRHPKGEPFLLSGLLYCGQCGQHMMGVTRHQSWRRKDGERVLGEYRYYQCQSRTNRGQCQYHTRRAAQLEEHVVESLRGMIADGLGEGVVSAESHGEQRQQEEARLRSLQRRYVEHVRRAVGGSGTLRQLRSVVEGLEAERQAVTGRLALYNGDKEQHLQLQQAQRRRLDEWDSLSVAQRQEVLRTFVSRITVGDDDAQVTLLNTQPRPDGLAASAV